MTKRSVNPKAAFGNMKPQLHLLPPIAELYTSLVLQGAPGEGGAATYGTFNWRHAQIHYTTYIGAIRRHMLAIQCGQDLDPKSKLPHLAHVSACCAIVMDAQACGMLIDDRPLFGDAAVELLDARTAAGYGAKRSRVKPQNCMTAAEFARLETAHARKVLAAYRARRTA